MSILKGYDWDSNGDEVMVNLDFKTTVYGTVLCDVRFVIGQLAKRFEVLRTTRQFVKYYGSVIQFMLKSN